MNAPPKDTLELLLKQVNRDKQDEISTSISLLRQKMADGFCCPNQEKQYLSFLGPPPEYINKKITKEWTETIAHVQKITKELDLKPAISSQSSTLDINSTTDKKQKPLIKSISTSSSIIVKKEKETRKEENTEMHSLKKRKLSMDYPSLSTEKWTEMGKKYKQLANDCSKKEDAESVKISALAYLASSLCYLHTVGDSEFTEKVYNSHLELMDYAHRKLFKLGLKDLCAMFCLIEHFLLQKVTRSLVNEYNKAKQKMGILKKAESSTNESGISNSINEMQLQCNKLCEKNMNFTEKCFKKWKDAQAQCKNLNEKYDFFNQGLNVDTSVMVFCEKGIIMLEEYVTLEKVVDFQCFWK